MPGEWVAHGCVRPTPCEVPSHRSAPQVSVVLCGHVRLCRCSALRASATRGDGRGSSASGETARHPTAHWLAGLKKGQERARQIPAGSNKDHNMRITAFSSPLTCTCSSPPLSTPHRRVWNRSEHGVGRGGGEPAQSEGGRPLADAPPGRLSRLGTFFFGFAGPCPPKKANSPWVRRAASLEVSMARPKPVRPRLG